MRCGDHGAEARRIEELTNRGLCMVHTPPTCILKMIQRRGGTDQSFVRREEGSMVHSSYGAGISPGIDGCLVRVRGMFRPNLAPAADT